MISPFPPVGGGILQLDDLGLAEIDRYQAVLKALLDGGQRDKEGLHVAEREGALAKRLLPKEDGSRYLE